MTLFYPFRAGFFQIEQLRVVDTFGQKIDLHEMSAERIFEPKPGLGLKPDHADELDANMFQLPPRLVQPSRLDFQFLANDDSGLDITFAQTPHAVCGWLNPDHLDGGLAVYSSKGEALGEILPAEFSVDDERSLLGGIDNPALCAVVSVLSNINGRTSTSCCR